MKLIYHSLCHINVKFQNVAVGDVWTAEDPPKEEEQPPPADQEKAVESHSSEKPQGNILNLSISSFFLSIISFVRFFLLFVRSSGYFG